MPSLVPGADRLACYDRIEPILSEFERELVTLNEKPLIVAYRNTGTQNRALREH
jgi:hypothetical protein